MTQTYRLNGDTRSWQPEITVRQAVTAAGLEGTWFAVALNGAVVPASQWAGTEIPLNGELDIIQPCQGG
ncbi:MAG TPA: sulfur carrier protein ThiS [Flexivirga sp.]|uniref:sulfur carrier protein ThiS n=1 Tax=Flexivirga sp. TaxID=1962927 RepID=UPI002C349259|nr:sulfur carrier protein ThiS [Flexivirga sp.]HWC21916.1 sulfur carrier protein ThiS [Flexivirga sp.]